MREESKLDVELIKTAFLNHVRKFQDCASRHNLGESELNFYQHIIEIDSKAIETILKMEALDKDSLS